jgi:DNA-directed RNA polymerase subunit H
MSDDNDVRIIHTSRQNLLKQLSVLGYDTSTYEAFGIAEVNTMMSKNQLDMLLEHVNGRRVYIKYHLGKTIRQNNIDEIIDDLFNIEKTLEKKDSVIIIIKDIPNDTINGIIKSIWENDGIFISVRGIKTLQFNVFDHEYVPKHEIQNGDEIGEIKKRYNILNDTMIPEISRFDPVALALLMRPKEICKITRSSKTSITSDFYRICV